MSRAEPRAPDGPATLRRMCEGSLPRIAMYVFMVAGSLAPLTAMVGARRWPQHTMRVGLVSLGLFGVAAAAAAVFAAC